MRSSERRVGREATHSSMPEANGREDDGHGSWEGICADGDTPTGEMVSRTHDGVRSIGCQRKKTERGAQEVVRLMVVRLKVAKG